MVGRQVGGSGMASDWYLDGSSLSRLSKKDTLTAKTRPWAARLKAWMAGVRMIWVPLLVEDCMEMELLRYPDALLIADEMHCKIEALELTYYEHGESR